MQRAKGHELLLQCLHFKWKDAQYPSGQFTNLISKHLSLSHTLILMVVVIRPTGQKLMRLTVMSIFICCLYSNTFLHGELMLDRNTYQVHQSLVKYHGDSLRTLQALIPQQLSILALHSIIVLPLQRAGRLCHCGHHRQSGPLHFSLIDCNEGLAEGHSSDILRINLRTMPKESHERSKSLCVNTVGGELSTRRCFHFHVCINIILNPTFKIPLLLTLTICHICAYISLS